MRPTLVRWRILALLALAGCIAYLLRLNMSVAGESMVRDLGLTEVQFGLVLSAFAWGYAIFQLPGGVYGQVAGPRRALATIIVAWGVITLLTGLVPAAGAFPLPALLGLLLALRFLQGVFQAPIFPVSVGGVVGRWFPTREWGFANSMITAGLTVGAAATGPLVAALVGAIGWRESFLVTGPLALGLAALWWWYARDDPAAHPAINAGEAELITAHRPEQATGAEARAGVWALLRNRSLLMVTLSYFLMNYVFYLFFNWFYYYLVEVRDLPAAAGGQFLAAQWMVGAVTAAAGGLACDRLSVRFGPTRGCRWTAMAGLLASAPLLVAGALAPGAGLAVALLSLSFGAIQFTDAAFWVAAMRTSTRHAPAATGLLNTGGNVMGGLGAVAVPLVAAGFGWTVAVGSGALAALLAALAWLGVRAEDPESDGRPPRPAV